MQEAFESCGPITSGGKHPSANFFGKNWQINFSSIYFAEMALATMHKTILRNVEPFWLLRLSASWDGKETLPDDPLFPQFVQTYEEHHPLHYYNAQELFRYFRNAGPLVSVERAVDIGHETTTCVVQYWNEEHANFARLNAGSLAPDSDQRTSPLPSFTLRAYNPYNLYITKLSPAVDTQDLRERFGEWGDIVEAKVVRRGTRAAYAFVSYRTKVEALHAMDAMRGTLIYGQAIEVRYHVPAVQGVFRETRFSAGGGGSGATNFASSHKPPASDTRRDPTPDPAASERERREEEALRRRREAEAAAAREAERRARRSEALSRRRSAEAGAIRARKSAADAEGEHGAARTRLGHAKEHYETARKDSTDAEEALAAAERALEAAQDRAAEALRATVGAAEAMLQAKRHELDAWSSMNEALEDRRHAEAEQERVYGETQAVMDETEDLAAEERRQEELAEAVRRMKEMREAEEADRREQEVRRKAEEAERERKAREEAERVAREKQEREARHKAYLAAAAAETQRCQSRDVKRWLINKLWKWNSDRALRRFEFVSQEFDDIKFCESQPLTFDSVPWPVLQTPLVLTFNDIDWAAVERFFEALKRSSAGESQYNTMVEKAHRRFHPDKWRSRGLLNTVLDEDLRKKLEKAGNIVAQAITPIWRASRSQ
ncbi:hypothetical protein PsYK624_087440 [Phanerochaete sordida]|uniref:RRM domain-containing protein n=1 Tax=Phanerochaete sordida TaxID=48140 RepID=A0A9P3LFG1_9APHY|nr:hypothetical protein PsYK624_087440 [Phanerochaete sordida]